MNELVNPGWSSDWLWSVPLIALTVTFHVWFMRNAYKAILKYMAVRGQFADLERPNRDLQPRLSRAQSARYRERGASPFPAQV